jgi:XTP/dITP diphosphohydrolase
VKILIATSNRGKVAELARLLPSAIELLTLTDVALASPEETGATFRANALLKARAAAESGIISLADDSGLEVDALGGAPGVRSARYAGYDATDERNNQRLLGELDGIDDAERSARFRSVVALVTPNGYELTAEGCVEGRIARTPRGSHGFGYDPLFIITDPAVPEYVGHTMAELEVSEKNRVSHRARAYAALARELSLGSHGRPELTRLFHAAMPKESL